MNNRQEMESLSAALDLALERNSAIRLLLMKSDDELLDLRNRVRRSLDKQAKDDGQALETIHMALRESTYDEKSVIDCCDILIGYIRDAKYKEDFKTLAPSPFKVSSSPLGWLWKAKLRQFCKDTETSIKVLNPDEIVRSVYRKQLAYSEISSKTWLMNNAFLVLSSESEFIEYFDGGAGISNLDDLSMIRARYLLLVELFRFSMIDPFEAGHSYTKKVLNLDTKGLKDFITPAGIINAMRYTKDEPKKSVKLEKFRSYLFTRLKEAKRIERSAYVSAAELSAPLLISRFGVDVTDEHPRNGAGRLMVGGAIGSRASRTPGISQTPYSGFYAIRIDVKRNNKKTTIYRFIELYRRDIQKARGVIVGEIKYDQMIERNSRYQEEWSYEEWLGMSPSLLSDEDVSIVSGNIEKQWYKQQPDVIHEMWTKGQKQ